MAVSAQVNSYTTSLFRDITPSRPLLLERTHSQIDDISLLIALGTDLKVLEGVGREKLKGRPSLCCMCKGVEQELTEITATREQLLQVYGGLQIKMDLVLDCIKDLKLPPVKTDTDAGSGVGSSNVEGRYGDVEMARILNSDRVKRIHRSKR